VSTFNLNYQKNQQQINRIDCHPTSSLLACAFESGELGLFDYSSGRTSKLLQQAHPSGVSTVLFANSGLNLISGGHDGAIRVWDLRTHKIVQEIEGSVAHRSKYEEGVMGLAINPEKPAFFASGGADCMVNLYELMIQ
jgi:WD40 repeat protein